MFDSGTHCDPPVHTADAARVSTLDERYSSAKLVMLTIFLCLDK